LRYLALAPWSAVSGATAATPDSSTEIDAKAVETEESVHIL